MKAFIFIFLMVSFVGTSQNMTNDILKEIYTSVSDSITGANGQWQFFVKQVPMASFTDVNHNRMRILSPITDATLLSDELLKAALVANFHTALDVKYAVSDGVLWAVFIHPLKELSKRQVEDAISQVYHANINFGTTFSSTSLTFPGSTNNKEAPVIEKEEKLSFQKS